MALAGGEIALQPSEVLVAQTLRDNRGQWLAQHLCWAEAENLLRRPVEFADQACLIERLCEKSWFCKGFIERMCP
jgi:hypothetical protein